MEWFVSPVLLLDGGTGRGQGQKPEQRAVDIIQTGCQPGLDDTAVKVD